MLHETIAIKLAEKITNDLFQNGFSEQADRLVLISSSQEDLGGWGRDAVCNRIMKILTDPELLKNSD